MEKFRQVFEQVPVGLNILELDETIAETNSQLCQLLGMEQADIIGRKFSDVIDWADKLNNKLPFDEILDRKIAIHEEIIPIVCAEGKPKWIHLTLAPLVGDLSMPHNFAGHHWQDVVQGVYVCMWKRIQR